MNWKKKCFFYFVLRLESVMLLVECVVNTPQERMKHFEYKFQQLVSYLYILYQLICLNCSFLFYLLTVIKSEPHLAEICWRAQVLVVTSTQQSERTAASLTLPWEQSEPEQKSVAPVSILDSWLSWETVAAEAPRRSVKQVSVYNYSFLLM